MAGKTLAARLAHGAGSAVKAVSEPLKDPAQAVDVAQLLNDLTKLPPDFSAGRSVNGIGTSTGGYVGIPGVPGLGIVRKHFCVFFIPVLFLDLYLVKDWSGSGGVFLGRISSDNAAKYVNMSMQSLATVFNGLAMLVVFGVVIVLLAIIFGSAR